MIHYSFLIGCFFVGYWGVDTIKRSPVSGTFFTVSTFLFYTLLFGLASAQADTKQAMTLLRKTTVMVNGSICTGSGSIVQGKSGNKYVLTNAHVCNCARSKGELFATFEGGELVKAKVVRQDWSKDLCAARTEDSREALTLGTDLLPTTEVNTRGYPHGRLTESHGNVKGDMQWEAIFGIEDVGNCPFNSEPLYGDNGNLAACKIAFTSTLTNLFSRPGSSGSPVVNDAGNLVGVISSELSGGDDYSAGMVTFSQVREFLSAL